MASLQSLRGLSSLEDRAQSGLELSQLRPWDNRIGIEMIATQDGGRSF
jgi:hypothetical protein